MPRVYLPLLPLPVLAVIVAVSACSKPRSDEPAMHVIPPPYGATAMADPKPAAPKDKIAPTAAEPAPSAEDIKEFERPVRK